MIRHKLTGILAIATLVAIGQAQTAPLKLSAALKPNPPVMGENTLDLLVTDATGAPVTGLKIASSVFMTNMNMGTAHPPVKETGKGHYKLVANFLMEGPWRITLKGGGLSRALDFNPGDKKVWKMPVDAASPKPPAVTPPVAPKEPTTPPVDKPVPPVTPPKTETKPTEVKQDPVPAKPKEEMQDMPGMQHSPGMEGMDHKSLKMPQLKSSGTVTVTGNEDWNTATGFGRNDAMVGMMIWMMVGGSGMEGMKMGAMKMDFSEANFKPGEGDDMAGMDMKNMPGMAMPNANGIKTSAKLSGSAKSGNNKIEFTVVDDSGKPIEKAKITLSVAMTNMDMGTTHPAVKELGKGRYSSTVAFSMVGPWRVTAKVEAGGKTGTFPFDFEAK